MVEEIINSYRLRIAEIFGLIKDIPEEKLCLQRPDFIPETICHPIWTLGHLCGSAQGIGEELLMDHWLENGWQEKYGQYSHPHSNGEGYHQKEFLIQTLSECQCRIEKKLLSMTDNELDGQMPDVRFHQIFPTLRHAVCGILIDHVSEHIKMLILWRYYLLGKSV